MISNGKGVSSHAAMATALASINLGIPGTKLSGEAPCPADAGAATGDGGPFWYSKVVGPTIVSTGLDPVKTTVILPRGGGITTLVLAIE